METWLSKRDVLVVLLLALGACTKYREQQSDNVGALVQKNQSAVQESPATAQTPSPPKLSPPKINLSYKDRKAWHDIIKWPQSCEEAFESTMSKKTVGLEFYELADKQYLIEIKCTLGAYQGFQVYTYLDETQSRPVAKLLTFVTYESKDYDKLDNTKTEELWGLPEFNPTTKELHILNKFRGPGDCGTLATYSFQRGTPKLEEFRAKTACDGKGSNNPESWDKVALP